MLAWQDPYQSRTLPAHTNVANRSANLGPEPGRAHINPKANVPPEVGTAATRAADVETKKKPTFIENVVEYTKGIAYGFAVDGLAGDGETIWALAKFSWKHSPLNPSFVSNLYDDYQFAKEVASKIDIKAWSEVLVSAASNGWDIVSAAHSKQVSSLTPRQEALLVKAGEILLEVEAIVKQMIAQGLTPYMKGRIVGMIAYELVTDALIGAATVGTACVAAPAAAAKVAAVIKKLEKFGDFAKPIIKALEKGAELRKRLDNFVETLIDFKRSGNSPRPRVSGGDSPLRESLSSLNRNLGSIGGRVAPQSYVDQLKDTLEAINHNSAGARVELTIELFERGSAGNARALYEASLDGGVHRGVVRLPKDATYYEVLHEFQHVQHHLEAGQEFFRLTDAAREIEAYHRLRQTPYWGLFSADEQIDAYRQIMRARNRRGC